MFAISNQCTHQGAPLDKGVVKIAGSVHSVTCPAHGSTFDLENGKVMRPPAAKPVPVYDVKIEDGRVFVRPRLTARSGRSRVHPRAMRRRGELTRLEDALDPPR